MIYGMHRAKGAPMLGALPGEAGPFGDRPGPDGPTTGAPPVLRHRVSPCPFCEAGPHNGQARTITVAEDHFVVTWHSLPCPHYAADQVLAGPGSQPSWHDAPTTAHSSR